MKEIINNKNNSYSDKSKDDRLRLLYMYQILLKYTDAENPLTTKNIQELMFKEHQIHLHRTTIPEYINLLRAAGIEIFGERRKSYVYYVEDRLFSIPELKLLIDAVQASKFINVNKTEELIRKLSSLASVNQADKLKRSLHISGKAKSDNKKGYYIVDMLNEAIYRKQKVAFFYFDYDDSKNQILKNVGKPYTVSPYDLIWDGDFYYLTGFCDEREEVRTFRVDRIFNIPEIIDEQYVFCPADYSVEKYTKESFRMYSAEEVIVVILRCDKSVMRAIIDKFGLDVDTEVIDENHFRANVTVCATPTFYRWVFGWGGKIRIESPMMVKECYLQMLKKALEFENL